MSIYITHIYISKNTLPTPILLVLVKLFPKICIQYRPPLVASIARPEMQNSRIKHNGIPQIQFWPAQPLLELLPVLGVHHSLADFEFVRSRDEAGEPHAILRLDSAGEEVVVVPGEVNVVEKMLRRAKKVRNELGLAIILIMSFVAISHTFIS